jgi:hypothetical protein
MSSAYYSLPLRVRALSATAPPRAHLHIIWLGMPPSMRFSTGGALLRRGLTSRLPSTNPLMERIATSHQPSDMLFFRSRFGCRHPMWGIYSSSPAVHFATAGSPKAFLASAEAFESQGATSSIALRTPSVGHPTWTRRMFSRRSEDSSHFSPRPTQSLCGGTRSRRVGVRFLRGLSQLSRLLSLPDASSCVHQRLHTMPATANHTLSELLRASRHLLPPPPFRPPCRCRAALRSR